MELLLKSRKFDVVRERVVGRDGRDHVRDYVIHPGAVVILPMLDEERCLILRQRRPAVGQVLWELPAGTLDIPGESLEIAAARELEEETGHAAGRMERMCAFLTSPGILSEKITAFVAGDLRPTRQNLGPTEEIDVETRELSEVMEMVRDGRIVDGKSVVTLLWYEMRRSRGW
ncbi:MAG: NUDIX hydrolase [Planctomycetota bacterium]|nr:MAG: NUDIX hydrolase [Planctomycetota bacterium]